MNIKKSEVELAIEIIKEKKEPVFYLELLKEIASRMKRPHDSATLSSIYSRLNLDHRLKYQEDGFWFCDLEH